MQRNLPARMLGLLLDQDWRHTISRAAASTGDTHRSWHDRRHVLACCLVGVLHLAHYLASSKCLRRVSAVSTSSVASSGPAAAGHIACRLVRAVSVLKTATCKGGLSSSP